MRYVLKSVIIVLFLMGEINGRTLWKGVEVPLPRKIIIHQDKIYLLSRKDRSKLYIYSLRNGKEIKTIGRKGTGPGELNWVVDFNIWKDGIYFYELYSGAIKIFDFSGKEKARSFFRSRINRASKKSITFTKFFIVDHKTILVIGYDYNKLKEMVKCKYHPFFLVRLRKNAPPLVEGFGEPPLGICKRKDEALHQLWQMHMNFSFYKGRLFYYDVDRFRIYVEDVGKKEGKILLEEKIKNFLPLKGRIIIRKFKGGASTSYEDYYFPQLRIFPFEKGFWVFIPLKEELLGFSPGIIRKYIYTEKGVKLVLERKTEFMPFAYGSGIFVGIDKDEKLVEFDIK